MITLTSIVVWVSYFISLYIMIFWFLVFLEKGARDKKIPLKNYPKVSVVIPAYNEEDNIKDTILSVLNLEYPRDKLNVVVVNDCSKDSTKKIVEDLISSKRYPNLKLINHIVNKGKGAALNTALKQIKTEFFVCMDADSTVEKGALIKLLPHFGKDEKITVVLPIIKVKKITTLLQKIQSCEYLINFFYKRVMSNLNSIHVAPGPFSIYKTKILKKVGYFDENNLTEDLEMALRLQKNNYKLIQVLDTEVYTLLPAKFKEFYAQRNRWYKGSLLNALHYKGMIFNKKHGDFAMIHMPRLIIAGILAVTLISLTLYNYALKPLFFRLRELSFIDFNILPQIDIFMRTFNIIDLNYINLFFGLIIFVLAFTILIYAYKYTNESLKKHGYITVPAYLVAYSILAAIVWLGVIVDLITRRIQRW